MRIFTAIMLAFALSACIEDAPESAACPGASQVDDICIWTQAAQETGFRCPPGRVEWVRNDNGWRQGQATARLDQRVCAPSDTPPEEIETAWVLSGGTPINAPPEDECMPDPNLPDGNGFDQGCGGDFGVPDGELVPDLGRRDFGPEPDQGRVVDVGTIEADNGRFVDAEVVDAEVVDGEPVPDQGMPPVGDYNFLLIADWSEGLEPRRAGADICGVSANCALLVSATLTLGGGEICQGEGPGCLTDRADVSASLDDGANCELDSVPSDYVSLGRDGLLSMEFDSSIAGCEVTIVELAGQQAEAYEVYVCDSDDAQVADCLADSNAVFTAAEGGAHTFNVPFE